MVVNIAEEYRLNITVRPDGSIFGFKENMEKLRHEIQCVAVKSVATND
jgi:hypothetical protein